MPSSDAINQRPIGLEAWDRRDYATFLAERCLPAAHRFATITS